MSEVRRHTDSGPPSLALAWAIWTRVCIEVGGVNGLAKSGIGPASRAEIEMHPSRFSLSTEYYKRIDALSDEDVAK